MPRHFWLYLTGQVTSSLGDIFGSMALSWLVYDLTGSMLAMGSIMAAKILTEVVVRSFGGALVDRTNRIRLMAWLDLSRTIAYVLPLVLMATGALELWHLYLLTVATGAANALFLPAAVSALPSMVSSEQLIRSNSLLQGLQQGIGLVGPSLAGLVVAHFGLYPALAADAISFLISCLTLFLLPVRFGLVERRPDRNYLTDLSEGYRFFKTAPLFIVLLAAGALFNVAGSTVNLLVPFVEVHLGGDAVTVGLLSSAISIGTLAGTGLASLTGRRLRLAILGALLPGPAAVVALGFVRPGQTLGAALLLALFGLCAGLFTILHTYLYQRLVPDRVRGRVLAVRMTLIMITLPVANLLSGALADRFGLPIMFQVMGVLPLVLLALLLCLPVLRRLNDAALPSETYSA